MVEDKVGTKDYLGITIDYDKEKNFDKFSLDTLKDKNDFNEMIKNNKMPWKNIKK